MIVEQLKIIRTISAMQELSEWLSDKDFVSYDLETTGLNKEDQVIGIAICADLEIAYYIILSYWDVKQQKLIDLETKKEAANFVDKLKKHKLIMHNAIFDVKMTESNFHVYLMDSLHTDTMVLAHLLDENRRVGLKDLGTSIFGESSRDEQKEMQASVHRNGGLLTKKQYELYKADADLIAKYGAKDALLTLKLFYTLVPELYDQGLDAFFYDDECMPLLRGPTYEMNTVGLKVDVDKLKKLKGEVETECLQQKAFIYQEINAHIKDTYKGTNAKNTFNIMAGQQLSWLLFDKLGNEFHTLTATGKEICKFLELKTPYAPSDKRAFIAACQGAKDQIYNEDKIGKIDKKTKKPIKAKKIGNYWKYLAVGNATMLKYSDKYKWVKTRIEYGQNMKLLSTYVEGILSRTKYGIIHPEFKQTGTTSGRYSSKNPNFQNLPRDDKRIKACIIARPGKVFVGADYSQLEPRVFASVSKDEKLLAVFKGSEDFYSRIGMEVFKKTDCTPHKDGSPNAFGVKYKKLRDIAKVVALSSTYGTTAFKMAPTLGMSTEECQQIINNYFDEFPQVYIMMLEAHELAKNNGVVHNLFGRPRRMPEAKSIRDVYGDSEHGELPYEIRNLLNLAVNHRIQSTAASIMNRAAIAFTKQAPPDVIIITQVHDEVIVECLEEDADLVVKILKHCMERTTTLPGVSLIAEPKIANNFASLK